MNNDIFFKKVSEAFQEHTADFAEDCQFSEKTAAYALNELESEERESVRRHLLQCGSCLKLVLAVRKTEAELKEHQTAGPYFHIFSLWNNIRERTERISDINSYLLPALGFVTACLMILFLWQYNISRPPELSDMIDESYQILLTDKKFTPDNKMLQLPWEESSSSFGFGTGTSSPAARAFGAGLWSGKYTMPDRKEEKMPEFLSPVWQNQKSYKDIHADDWSETVWEPYFSMGKCFFLIRAACISDKEIHYGFWEKQSIILEHIHRNFNDLPENTGENTEIINATISNIQTVLKDLDKRSPDRKKKRVIASETDNFITYMAPKP